jgi:hypothetical protein
MKNLLLYLFIFFLTISVSYGQNRWGLYGHKKGSGYSILTMGVGPAYLFGDVGGKKLTGLVKGTTFNMNSTRNFVTFGYRYIFPNNLSLRANILYGNFVGEDDGTNLQSRGYVFKSRIFETSVQGEWFILGGPLKDFRNAPHSLYIFAGAGNINYLPTLTGNNRDFDEIKLQIGNAPIIPFGLGYELSIGNGISIGSELAFRYAFSDFLDGLRTPYSKSNDLLVNFNITLSYNLSLGRY